MNRSPWRIGTLKYLEMKIKKWPSRANWGQARPNGPNGAKQVKQGQTDLDCCSIFNSVFMGDLHFSCYFIGHQ